VRSLIAVALVVGAIFLFAPAQGKDSGRAVPEFTHQSQRDWFNSAPLSVRDLRGKVVLIDFWTYGCWNSYRSFPWLKQVEARFADRPFAVVGVHTPEFEHEKDRARVGKNIKKFGLQHPVMVDNDHSYWRKMNNRYWPAFYLVDKQGRIRATFVGETHAGRPRALKIERTIEKLLDEGA